MDEREQYRELIRDNLEIDIRSQDRHYDLDRVNEIVEIMLDAVCSTSPTIRINGEDMPQPVVNHASSSWTAATLTMCSKR